jgi:hypothetical protein
VTVTLTRDAKVHENCVDTTGLDHGADAMCNGGLWQSRNELKIKWERRLESVLPSPDTRARAAGGGTTEGQDYMVKKKSASPKLHLTLPEYNRIYEIIYSVLDGRANTPFACMFFSAAGALILNKYYRIPARAVAGAFLLCTNSAPSVISIAKNEDGMVTSSRDGFHMWVQTKTHVIDFMAPIFNDSIEGKGYPSSVPRKMFQRPLSTEVKSIDEMYVPGDYLTMPNIELTDELVDSLFDRAESVDLLNAVDRWFKKYPKKLDELSLLDELGEVHKLTLCAPQITGAW